MKKEETNRNVGTIKEALKVLNKEAIGLAEQIQLNLEELGL